jgi:hypothetical protein
MDQKNIEIDLTDLSIKLYYLIRRRYKLLLVFIFIGIVYGGIVYGGISFFTKQYSKKYIATSYTIPAKIVVDIINSINEIHNHDKDNTSKILNIGPDEVKKLASIKADTIGTYYTSDLERTTTIEIDITGDNSLNFDAVYKGLVNYVDSNQFVKSVVTTEKQKSQEIMQKFDEQIIKLDSIQIVLLRLLSASNPSNYSNISGLNGFSNNYYSNGMIELETKKQTEVKKISQTKGLFTIDKNNAVKSINASFYRILLKKVPLLFGLGIIFSLFLEFRRFVKTFENKTKNDI